MLSALDLRSSFRVLRKSPGFASVAILTLALGMAANITVFSWIQTTLVDILPGVPEPRRLVAVEEYSDTHQSLAIPHPDFRDYQRELQSVSGVFGSHWNYFLVGPPQESRRVSGEVVSANMFEVLGVRPFLGRLFSSAEDRDDRGAFAIAVISYRLWRSQFQSDPGIAGKAVRINGRQLTVIGVTPPEFRGSMGGVTADLWVPLSIICEMGSLNTWAAADRNARFLSLTARLREGQTPESATAEASLTAGRIAAAYPKTHASIGARVLPLWQAHSGAQALLLNPLRLLMAASVLVLLVACANVTNLLLARSVARQKEFGVRMALGAGQGRLASQILAEVLVLAGLAAIAGVTASAWSVSTVGQLLPQTNLPITAILEPISGRPSLSVLFFVLFITLGSTVTTAFMPLLFSRRVPVLEAIQEAGRGGDSGVRSHRARRLLVILEVSLTVVSLVCAVLLTRSFHYMINLAPGFDQRNVFIAQLRLSSAAYSLLAEKQFNRDLALRLAGAPGVNAVSYAHSVPLWFGGPQIDRVHVEGHSPPSGEVMLLGTSYVGPGYFSLLRIPLVEGRDFTDLDVSTAPPVAIVNRTFVDRFFGGGNPIGRHIQVGDYDNSPRRQRWRTVVGVVQNSKYSSPAEPALPFLYTPFQQTYGTGHNNFFYIRSGGDDGAALESVRAAVASLDPTIGLYDVLPLSEYAAAANYPQKVAALLLAGLAMLSLFLAALGLYSVMACQVAERTHEIGVRMALGAKPWTVIAMVMREGMILTGTGLAAGIFACLVLTGWMRSFLVGVAPHDPLTFGGVALFLLLVASAACYLPARSATRVDPIATLRNH